MPKVIPEYDAGTSYVVLSDWNGIQTYNHFVQKQTLSHLKCGFKMRIFQYIILYLRKLAEKFIHLDGCTFDVVINKVSKWK